MMRIKRPYGGTFLSWIFLGISILFIFPCHAKQDVDLKYYKWRDSRLAKANTTDCYKALQKEKVEFDKKDAFLENRVCDAKNLVQVKRFNGLEIIPAALMTCDLALKLSEWIKISVRPEAKKQIGSELVAIRQSGTYSCRKMRTLEFISEHSFANAIDIPEFRFRNGDRITVINHWKKPSKQMAFLKAIHKAGCERFPVSLGPEYDKHHENHLHLDSGPLTLCK